MKNIIILISGSGLAQLIPILVIPILSRMYTADDFGDLSLYANIVGILVIIASGRFEHAILLPKKESTATYIVAGSFIITLSFSIFLLILVIIFKIFFSHLLVDQRIAKWILFIPLSVFSSGIFNILTVFANKYKLYKFMSIGGFVKSITTSGIKVLGGIKKAGAFGLIIGNIIGNIFSMLFISIVCFRFKKYQLKYLSYKGITNALKVYVDFPKYNMPRALLNTISGSLPIFIFYKYFGTSVTGFYSMSLGLSLIPIQIVVQSIYQVYSEKIIKEYNNRIAIAKSIINIAKTLTMVFSLPFIILIIFAPDIIVFFLGDKWLESGKILQYIIPWLFMVLVSTPLAFIPKLSGKLKTEMIIDMVYLVLRIIALYIGVLINNYYYSIFFFSLVGVFVLGFNLFWFIHLAKKLDNQYMT